MTEPQKDDDRRATSILQIAEKPIGIGLVIGIVAGAGNSIALGIPLWQSISAGAILGMLVCLLACPAMKRINRKTVTKTRARAASAFTTLE